MVATQAGEGKRTDDTMDANIEAGVKDVLAFMETRRASGEPLGIVSVYAGCSSRARIHLLPDVFLTLFGGRTCDVHYAATGTHYTVRDGDIDVTTYVDAPASRAVVATVPSVMTRRR